MRGRAVQVIRWVAGGFGIVAAGFTLKYSRDILEFFDPAENVGVLVAMFILEAVLGIAVLLGWHRWFDRFFLVVFLLRAGRVSIQGPGLSIVDASATWIAFIFGLLTCVLPRVRRNPDV